VRCALFVQESRTRPAEGRLVPGVSVSCALSVCGAPCENSSRQAKSRCSCDVTSRGVRVTICCSGGGGTALKGKKHVFHSCDVNFEVCFVGAFAWLERATNKLRRVRPSVHMQQFAYHMMDFH